MYEVGSEQHSIFSKPLEPFRIGVTPHGFKTHPDLPDKLFRYYDYGSVDEATINMRHAKAQLEYMEANLDVPYVHFSPVVGKGEIAGDIRLYQMTEIVKDGVSFDTICEMGHASEEIVAEFDKVACGLISRIGEVLDQGGIINSEFMRLDQFVISPSREASHRCVLVDVSPMHPIAIRSPELRADDGSDVAALCDIIADFTRGVIDLKQLSDFKLDCDVELQQLIRKIPNGQAVEIDQFKSDLLAALDSGTMGKFYEPIDFEEMTQWELFVAEHVSSARFVSDFDSDTAIEHFMTAR